ncbi:MULTISPECIES: VanZ family protein [unclassified Microbacterium]|uniref:VanZ family protein n=1 Tax=unclassified Microbacterium TaxID=2609290 RepID=UPI0012FB1CF7|nr:VanZ family protein [Microbacterium sp. MAH-37]
MSELGLDAMADAEVIDAPTPVSRWHRLSTWLIIYAVAVAIIVFWPHPAQIGIIGLIDVIKKVIPGLTGQRIEFGLNILLFVPLGVGMALLMPKLRYLVMPVALLVTLTIESVQGLFYTTRGPSIDDIIANTAGACLGLVGVVVWERWRERHPLE